MVAYAGNAVAAASKINRRMILLACDAQLNPDAEGVIYQWFKLAQKWTIPNNRPALARSLERLRERISPVICDCCGCRTTKAEALTIRHGEEVHLCPHCAEANGSTRGEQ